LQHPGVASKVRRHETAKCQQIQKSNTNTYFAILESGMAGKCQEKTLTSAIACRSLTVIATSAEVRCSTSAISACSIATSMVCNVLTPCTVERAAVSIVESRAITRARLVEVRVVWTSRHARLTRSQITVPGAITAYIGGLQYTCQRMPPIYVPCPHVLQHRHVLIPPAHEQHASLATLPSLRIFSQDPDSAH